MNTCMYAHTWIHVYIYIMLNMINISPNFVPGSTGTGALQCTRRRVPSARRRCSWGTWRRSPTCFGVKQARVMNIPLYARRMGQPTQRATNYTARSNIEPAQIFLHANGQGAPRSGGARDVGRGAGSHTPSIALESTPIEYNRQ